MNIDITALYVCIDDFCKLYEESIKQKLLPKVNQRNRSGKLSLSEMMLIEVMYHFSPFKNFKTFYEYGICQKYRNYFKDLPCYERFVALKKQLLMPLSLMLQSLTGEETGLYFADSTTLKVCRKKRIKNHKTFAGIAERGKSTMGWFFGFKLHMLVNHKGEIMAVKITKGNKDDRSPLAKMLDGLSGKCFADKGYVSQKLFKELMKKNIQLITGIKKNMKNYLMPAFDKIMLRKRFIIETIFGVLKNSMNLEHSRHRSPTNALTNIIAALLAYTFKPNKPKIKTNLISNP